MKKKQIWILVGVLAMVLAAAGLGYRALTANQSPLDEAAKPDSSSASASEQEEKPQLPEFTILDMEGNAVKSTAFQGKPTIINFWATWCGYCKDEMPEFEKAFQKYGDQINFVMIDAVDGQRETIELGKQYVADHGYTFPVYFDTEMEAVFSCGVRGFPATLFVNADGEVLLGWPGYLDGETLNDMIESMLK